MLAGSPVVNINWFTLLLAILAPIAWPVHRSTSARAISESSVDAPRLQGAANT
jgi:hypothetical protein